MPMFTFQLQDFVRGERTYAVPGEWVICQNCSGDGKHDHSAVRGLTSEDFDADPDFRGDYFAGRYDARCEECGGTGKALLPSVSACTYSERRLLAEYRRRERDFSVHDAQFRAESDAERRAGC